MKKDLCTFNKLILHKYNIIDNNKIQMNEIKNCNVIITSWNKQLEIIFHNYIIDLHTHCWMHVKLELHKVQFKYNIGKR